MFIIKHVPLCTVIYYSDVIRLNSDLERQREGGVTFEIPCLLVCASFCRVNATFHFRLSDVPLRAERLSGGLDYVSHLPSLLPPPHPLSLQLKAHRYRVLRVHVLRVSLFLVLPVPRTAAPWSLRLKF